MTAARLDATVLIATYNRAALLDETLASLRRLRVSPHLRWEAIVVDNNSTDGTRAVVERHARDFPVTLRYLFEPAQGRSSALNTGIEAAAGDVLAFTDDDVRVAEGWLTAACDVLRNGAPARATAWRNDRSIAYAGAHSVAVLSRAAAVPTSSLRMPPRGIGLLSARSAEGLTPGGELGSAAPRAGAFS